MDFDVIPQWLVTVGFGAITALATAVAAPWFQARSKREQLGFDQFSANLAEARKIRDEVRDEAHNMRLENQAIKANNTRLFNHVLVLSGAIADFRSRTLGDVIAARVMLAENRTQDATEHLGKLAAEIRDMVVPPIPEFDPPDP